MSMLMVASKEVALLLIPPVTRPAALARGRGRTFIVDRHLVGTGVVLRVG